MPSSLSTRIAPAVLSLGLLACSSAPATTQTAVEVPKTTETELVTPAPTPKLERTPAKSTTLPGLTLESTDEAAMIPELEAWLEKVPTPLRLSWEGAELRYEPRAKSHELYDGEWKLFVGFDGPAETAADADQLAERFEYWGIDHAIVPIDANGWTFRLQTPQSSSSEGFEVLSYRDGVAKLRIEGRFFALWGRHDETDGCKLMADAPAPDHCFVNVEKPVPFELVVEAKIVD